jgi:hypothetical protein
MCVHFINLCKKQISANVGQCIALFIFIISHRRVIVAPSRDCQRLQIEFNGAAHSPAERKRKMSSARPVAFIYGDEPPPTRAINQKKSRETTNDARAGRDDEKKKWLLPL